MDIIVAWDEGVFLERYFTLRFGWHYLVLSTMIDINVYFVACGYLNHTCFKIQISIAPKVRTGHINSHVKLCVLFFF